MELINIMEETVIRTLEDVWEREEMCKCDLCRLDVISMALNNLPPRYVVTSRGLAFSKANFLEMQKNIDVITAIGNAIRVVKNNPRHG